MKSIKSYAVQAFAALAMASVSVCATATIITFEDLPASGTGAEIADGYRGLNWDNFYVLNGPLYGPAYSTAPVSGTNIGVNGFFQPASFSSATAFNLHSLYLKKAWFDGLTRVDGYSGNTLMYSVDIYSSTNIRTFAYLNWSNLTKVTISDADGTWQTAVDNIAINVPEPETYAMLLAGLALVGATIRRKRMLT